MRYDFDWDPKKAKTNARKHEISFERATTIFRDPHLLSIPDEKHSETEERWITIGLDENGILLVLVHTFEKVLAHSARIRVISAERPQRRKLKTMKKEYDFSKGERGKFHNPDGELNLPIYLDREIADFVQKLSVEKKVDRSQIVNKLLRKDMEIIKL